MQLRILSPVGVVTGSSIGARKAPTFGLNAWRRSSSHFLQTIVVCCCFFMEVLSLDEFDVKVINFCYVLG